MLQSVSTAKEPSRQLWAVLGPLVAGDSQNATNYKNLPRHNDLEAWERKEDKLLILQDLLPAVINPRAAVDMAGYSQALEDWETTRRFCLPRLGDPHRLATRSGRLLSSSCRRTSRHT